MGGIGNGFRLQWVGKSETVSISSRHHIYAVGIINIAKVGASPSLDDFHIDYHIS